VTFAFPTQPSCGIGAVDLPVGSLLAKLHLKATEAIAFLVGPVKDGVVKTYTLPPIPLTPNFYHHLPEITDSTPNSPGPYHWPWTRHVAPVLTNAQRLSHPLTTQRREENRLSREQEQLIIDQQVAYITNSYLTVPPTTHPKSCLLTQHMNCVFPTNNQPTVANIIPGTPDNATPSGLSPPPPMVTTIDPELVALYNLISPIDDPNQKLPIDLTYSELIQREYLRTRKRQNLKKKKQKRQLHSPIISPINTNSSPTLSYHETESPPTDSVTHPTTQPPRLVRDRP
jgi:hypothetical protein